MLDAGSEIFVVHIAIWKREEIAIDPDRKAQIEAQNRAQREAQIEALIFNTAATEIPVKYSDYSNVFSAENATELPENTGINEHAIKLEEGKEPPFGSI